MMRYQAEEIASIESQRDDLTVTTPTDGKVIAGDLSELKGRYFHDGEPLNVTVAKDDKIYIYALLDQKDAALPFAEAPTGVEVRFEGDVGRVIENDKDHPNRVKIVRWQPGSTLDARYNALTTQAGEEGIPDPQDKSGRKLAVAAFPVIIAVENDGGYFRSGQRAHLRFDMQKRPLVWQWARRIRQLIQSESAQNKWL
jgi:hypothetical protein